MSVFRIVPHLLWLAMASLAHAGPRTSASYTIATDTADGGGTRTASASYTHDGSAGDLVAVATVAAPIGIVKSGYLGQLYDITALQLTAVPLTIDEAGTRQLTANQLLDDATTLSLAASAVIWSVQSGPLEGISNSGVATAGLVGQDTAAIVQGAFGGFTATLSLTVRDTIVDNFGTYAGDGIADAWQMFYFGADNPEAAPDVISDGSGLTNRFKYIAGLIPRDATSKFTVQTQRVPGQPGQFDVIFSPAFADRQYIILSSTTLAAGSWQALTAPVSGSGGAMIYTDTDAGGTRKFYRVQVVKP